MPINHIARKETKQNLRDLAWTTVYFGLLGCTSPVLEALYYNAAKLDQAKERVRQTLKQHLGLRHFEDVQSGSRGIYFPTKSHYEFEFSINRGTVWPLNYAIDASNSRQIYFRCERLGPFGGRVYSKENWFKFLQSDLQ